MDEKHSPKLWARFLDGLLATPMAKVQLSPGALKGGSLPKNRRRTTHRSGSAGAADKNQGGSSPSSSATSPGSQRGASPESIQPSPPTNVASLSAQAPSLPAVAEEVHVSSQPTQSSSNPQYSYVHENQAYQVPVTQMPPQQQPQPMQGDAHMHNALHMNVGEVFPSFPLFDNDLFQSMQAMPDTSIWQDMNMPG